jgi:hypothetical protein
MPAAAYLLSDDLAAHQRLLRALTSDRTGKPVSTAAVGAMLKRQGYVCVGRYPAWTRMRRRDLAAQARKNRKGNGLQAGRESAEETGL